MDLNSIDFSTLTPDAISRLLGGNLPTAPTYQTVTAPSGLGGTGTLDNQLIGLLGGQTALPSSIINQLLATLTGAAASNPYAGGYQGAAGTAGASSGVLGTADVNKALELMGLATGANGNLTDMLKAAFDPQKALFSRSSQQLQDALNANMAQQGLLGSPMGQGIVGQGMANFDIDWQNNLLARMTSGLSAYTQGVQGVGSNLTTAANLGNTGVAQQLGAGALPYGTAQTITGDSIANLLKLLEASQGSMSGIGNLINAYQNTASGRAATQGNIATQNYRGQDQQYQRFMQGLAALLAGRQGGGPGSAPTAGAPGSDWPGAGTPGSLPSGTPSGGGGGYQPPTAWDTGGGWALPAGSDWWPADQGASGGATIPWSTTQFPTVNPGGQDLGFGTGNLGFGTNGGQFDWGSVWPQANNQPSYGGQDLSAGWGEF